MPNIIQIENIQYGHILKNLSFVIQDNFITISGPNNSGKTTLIRILNREIKGYSGTITINNQDINDYKIDEFTNIIQTIIPTEILFLEETVEEELKLQANNIEEINTILEELKLKRILFKKTNTLSEKEIIYIQLVLALLHKPKILLLDNISSYLKKQDYQNIISFLKHYQTLHPLTIITTCINLEESIESDYLYILNQGELALEGKPLELLKKDNIINKIGLNLPFMIDLSVKLMDYDLLEDIILDKDRMVEELWK